jgi:hypothetical protein
MISETSAHYDALLDGLPMIEQALCWTVVRGLGKPVTVQQVIARLGADPATLAERDFDESFDRYPAGVVQLAEVGSAVVLFEVNGSQGQRPEVLRWLSEGASVHGVYWHVNGADRLVYAAYGKVITGVDVFRPESRHGVDPAALDEELQELVALRADDGNEYRPAAMAVVERCTGVRLEAEWFERPRPSVIIAKPLPEDPSPPTALAAVDPDLHVLLTRAGREVQRAALVRTVRVLAERLDLAGEPAVSHAIAALAQEAEGEYPRSVLELRSRLGDDFRAVEDRESFQQSPIWWRMQAGMAISTALTPASGYSDPLDALNHARSALQDGWPALRDELRGLARAGIAAASAGN